MKPTSQTNIGEGSNCFAACVASILEISIENVPNFFETESTLTAFVKFNKWLKEKFNMIYIEIRWSLETDPPMPEAYCIVIGKSPIPILKGIDHCVVGFGQKIVFDPYPGKRELMEKDKAFRTYGFFIPVDPKILR